MQRHHVAPSTFTDWSCIPPPPSSLLDLFASFGAPESLLSAQMPPKKPKISKTNETDVQQPSIFSACPLPPTVAPTVNPFFPELGIASESSASTSPSQSGFNVGQFFAHESEKHQADEKKSGNEDEISVICETYTCVGGTWFGGSVFHPCIKRKQTDGVRHAKSMVCTVHHSYVKCNSCNVRVHDGCHAPCPTGYSLPQSGTWHCLQCTLKLRTLVLDKKEAVVKPEGGADASVYTFQETWK